MTITQADRDAVDAFHNASFTAIFNDGGDKQTVGGNMNKAHTLLLEAFAAHREAAEARARIEGAKAMRWQDIATAPKDGTRILLARYGWTVSMDGVEQGSAEWRARLFDDMAPREHRLLWMTNGHWSAQWENWNDGCEPCGLASPTHWMPVPANPPVCAVPPTGWACTRAPGHEGPCAAIAALDPAQIAGGKP